MQQQEQPHQFTNPEVDLERAADALLNQVSPPGMGSGFYSEKQLRRKIQRDDSRLPRLAESRVSQQTADLLVDRRMSELIDAANLTAIQEILYRLHVAGFGARRMAWALGIRRQVLNQRLRAVKRRIRAAYLEGKYAGWYEVYLSEVNRPAYRRRK